MVEEKRSKERIQSLSLLYLCVKENDDVIQQGMGRTINISENGIRLETNFPIDSKKNLYLSIGIEDDIVDIKGRIIYYIEKNSTYEFGIEFQDIDERASVILNQYVSYFTSERNAT